MLPCPTHPILQRPNMVSVNIFLGAGSYYIFNIHIKLRNKTFVEMLSNWPPQDKTFPSPMHKHAAK